jgi:hypothetical protein
MAPFSSSSTKKNKLDTPGPVKKLFTREPHNFRFHRLPTIHVSSPDCGPSGQIGNLNALAGAGAADTPANFFLTLTWQFEIKDSLENEEAVTEKLTNTTEYLLIIEDLDSTSSLLRSHRSPLAIFYAIPRSKTSITSSELIKSKVGTFERITIAQRDLIGGFKYGELDGKMWRVPKRGHRIYFQVVALRGTVDGGSLSEFPTIGSFRGAAEGKVVGWGEWVGVRT